MKSKFVKAVSIVCILSIFLACNQKKEEPIVVDKEQIKKEIQAREDEFANVYNSNEVKNIGYYADDATIFYQNRPPVIGKPAIIDVFKADLEANLNTISFKTNEVFPSSDGNQVVEIGAYTVFDSSKTVINKGNYMIMFEKRNGIYVAVREMSASDQPLP